MGRAGLPNPLAAAEAVEAARVGEAGACACACPGATEGVGGAPWRDAAITAPICSLVLRICSRRCSSVRGAGTTELVLGMTRAGSGGGRGSGWEGAAAAGAAAEEADVGERGPAVVVVVVVVAEAVA
jgi:hypothetical protein